jgi:hypothetical protein
VQFPRPLSLSLPTYPPPCGGGYVGGVHSFIGEDHVFESEDARRLKALLSHAEGPLIFNRAIHFLPDDQAPNVGRTIIEFLDRTGGLAG